MKTCIETQYGHRELVEVVRLVGKATANPCADSQTTDRTRCGERLVDHGRDTVCTRVTGDVRLHHSTRQTRLNNEIQRHQQRHHRAGKGAVCEQEVERCSDPEHTGNAADQQQFETVLDPVDIGTSVGDRVGAYRSIGLTCARHLQPGEHSVT